MTHVGGSVADGVAPAILEGGRVIPLQQIHLGMIMRVREKKIDDRPYLQRRSYLGENISNKNWIMATVLLGSCGFAVSRGWIVTSVAFGVAGLLSIVWNPGVAKTATIIGGWIVVGSASAWVLGLACNAMFGQPALGHAIGLGVGIIGIVLTID